MIKLLISLPSLFYSLFFIFKTNRLIWKIKFSEIEKKDFQENTDICINRFDLKASHLILKFIREENLEISLGKK